MKILLGLALFLFSLVTLADSDCEYLPPLTETINYKKGDYSPVYFSEFKLDLPGLPTGFLSTDGFTALYPERQYASISHLSKQDMQETLLNLSPQLTGVSDYYRLIYKAHTTLSEWNQKELDLQRNLLGLDCRANVSLFKLNGIEIIFHRSRDSTHFHQIFILNGNDAELITVKGSDEMAAKIIRSIERKR